jgi:hypothetical protein
MTSHIVHRRVAFAGTTAVLLALHASSLFAAGIPQAVLAEKHRAVLKDHCVSCHGAENQKGTFRVDDLPFTITTIEVAEKWQKVLNAINAGEMPPEDEKQPAKDAKADLLEDLSQVMVAARRTLNDSQGVITMRRLNRREYANTIRDLLGVEIDVRSLPADSGAGNFDTAGASLFMSSDQFQLYRSLGAKALSEAFHLARTPVTVKTLRLEPETSVNKAVEREMERQVSIRKRFGLWTRAVNAAAALPENARVAAEIRQRTKDNPQKFYLEWEKLKDAPSPAGFGFPDAADAVHHEGQWERFVPEIADYLALPLVRSGVYLGAGSLSNRSVAISMPGDWPPGDYRLRIRLGCTEPERVLLSSRTREVPDTKVSIPFHAERCFIDVAPSGAEPPLSTHHVTAKATAPQELVVPLHVESGGNRYFRVIERGSYEGRPNNYFEEARSRNRVGSDPVLWVDWLEVEGPMVAASCMAAREEMKGWLERLDKKDWTTLQFIQAFAAKALRGRPPAPTFLERLATIHDEQSRNGMKPRLEDTLAVVLASPSFLYLAEPGTDRKPRLLTDTELASRLSYFLWSAPPDGELLSLAKQGALVDPKALDVQTDRLLADERAGDFVAAFVGQWLGLSRLDFFQFNIKMHRDFDLGMKEAARQEVYQTFAHLLHHSGSLSRLLKSDTVVINGILANYYDIPGVAGDAFREVKLPPGSPRGGLLGMAGILAMGGNGEHTSPVERGAWVLRKLMHSPPPPAPPNVPMLTRLEGKPLTTRELIAAHQEEPQCAQCHRKIDPIGFGLENFSAAGKWRTEDDRPGVPGNRRAIDPSGAFYKGASFRDYPELRDQIAANPERFARGFAEALTEYGLGRSVGFQDEDLIEAMMSRAQAKDFAIREFVHALVSSKEFRRK